MIKALGRNLNQSFLDWRNTFSVKISHGFVDRSGEDCIVSVYLSNHADCPVIFFYWPNKNSRVGLIKNKIHFVQSWRKSNGKELPNFSTSPSLNLHCPCFVAGISMNFASLLQSNRKGRGQWEREGGSPSERDDKLRSFCIFANLVGFYYWGRRQTLK